MGFRWRDAVKGGINGFRAGSRFGPYGMIIGTAAGAVGGGYGKDIDKKVTGNSQSGMTSGLIETAGNLGSSGSSGTQAAGVGGNLFDRFTGGDKPEKGYENNPAVLARSEQKNQGSSGGMGSIGMGGGLLDGIMGSGSQSSNSDGGFENGFMGLGNLFNRGNSNYSSGSSGSSGLDMNSILQLVQMFKK